MRYQLVVACAASLLCTSFAAAKDSNVGIFGKSGKSVCFLIFPENSGMIFRAFIKTFPGNSRTKMEGKDHIYLDK